MEISPRTIYVHECDQIMYILKEKGNFSDYTEPISAKK
jgi:hypothetical protein